MPEEDITVSEMCGGKESYNGQEIEVSEAAIREVLDTGLFSSRGPNRIGWAHQTYAEYLARALSCPPWINACADYESDSSSG